MLPCRMYKVDISLDKERAILDRLLPKGSSLFACPFREDRNPSCSLFVGRDGKYRLHDFSTGRTLKIVDIVATVLKISREEAVKWIESFEGTASSTVKTETSSSTNIDIQIKPFTQRELMYWQKYGITEDLLRKYGVYSVKGAYINGYLIKLDEYSFAYVINDRIKIYCPFSNKDNLSGNKRKWLSNTTNTDVFGLNLLSSSKVLIITSSLKDVMVLNSLGFQAIAFQSELVKKSEFIDSLIGKLKLLFTYIFVLFDNDLTGQVRSQQLVDEYDLINIRQTYLKDISDYHAKFGKYKCFRYLKRRISRSFSSNSP